MTTLMMMTIVTMMMTIETMSMTTTMTKPMSMIVKTMIIIKYFFSEVAKTNNKYTFL